VQDYLTPLHVAAHCGNVRIAKVLLDSKCQVSPCALVIVTSTLCEYTRLLHVDYDDDDDDDNDDHSYISLLVCFTGSQNAAARNQQRETRRYNIILPRFKSSLQSSIIKLLIVILANLIK